MHKVTEGRCLGDSQSSPQYPDTIRFQPRIAFRSVLCGIFVRDQGSYNKQSPDTAILLAAGRGRRLGPVGRDRPKCLIVVETRPIIDYIFDALVIAQISHVYIITHHLEDQIRSYVLAQQRPSLTFSFCHQPELLGTANAVNSLPKELSARLSFGKPLVVCATDYVLPRTYLAELIDYHISHNFPITLSLRPIASTETRESSVVERRGERVVRIIEKPTRTYDGTQLASSLLYVLPGAVFHFLSSTPRSARGEYELADTINLMIANGYSAQGCLQKELQRIDWVTAQT
jgi:UDP-N-acetylglucosamine diphosphorylase / glucose-1-phosphate thymidylyltransferase / UDP-N-acetylgalactosamine diphosphorylase / glucosamine-1-phosphate N-acetyltransferase / galactosamine-1-phosphate N-acetyltransferase